MATTDELEARLAALEARLAVPLAANPPITVGELTDVPSPGSPIASQWAQEVSGRVVHRFASLAAATASNLQDGSRCVAGGQLFHKVNGFWGRDLPTTGSAAGLGGTFGLGGILATTDIPADGVARRLLAIYHSLITATAGGINVNMELNAGFIQAYRVPNGPSQVSFSRSDLILAANTAYTLRFTSGGASLQVIADSSFHTISWLAVPVQ